MSVLPEVILHRAVIAGFRAMRQDSRVLDGIFRHLNQTQLEAVKKFILETPIEFNINFPREDLKVPSLTLILKNEGESEAFIGDIMGDKTDLYVPDPELQISTLGGNAASTTDSSGLPVKVAGPLNVSQQTDANSLLFDEGEDITEIVENLLENPPGCLKLYVVEGAGAGQVYTVLRLRPDGVDIEGAFDPQLDDTSVVDIREFDDPELAVGEPSRVYAQDGSYLRKGVQYNVNYALHVLAGQQEQVIYLYATIKALLLSQRVFLESQGIKNLQIGGTDFAPRSEYLPDEVFQRVMNLSFVYPFSILEEQETFKNIQINYWVEDDIIVKFPVTL